MMTMKQQGGGAGKCLPLQGWPSSHRPGLMEKATEGVLHTYRRFFLIYLFARGNFHHYLSRSPIQPIKIQAKDNTNTSNTNLSKKLTI